MEKDTKIVLIIIGVVIILLAAILIIINPSTFTPATNSLTSVTVYQDINYGGSSQEYGVGSYTLSQMEVKGTTNDSISSIKIPAGYIATFYQDDNFGGAVVVKQENDTSLVGSGWNDRVSSMIIAKVPQQ